MSEKDNDSIKKSASIEDVNHEEVPMADGGVHNDEQGKASIEEEEKQEKGEKEKRSHLIRPAWLRITLKTLMWIVVVILLIPVLLYIPPVQTFVKNIACNMVNKSTGMKIDIERFRLKWPVDVSLAGVTVLEASGDTMVFAKEVVADVKLLPLLKMDVDINRLQLVDGYYRMVSPDSSMILKVKAGLLEVDDRSSANIATSEILLNKAHLKDGNLSLYMNVWKQKPTPTDSTTTPFLIKANELKLDNFAFQMSMLPTIDTLMLNAGNLTVRKGVVDLRKNMVTASYLGTSDGAVTYLTPTPEYISEHPAPVADTTQVVASAPMIIKGDSVELSRFSALYAVKGAKPLPGFDPSYIEVNDVNIILSHFYNAASTVELPITKIEAKERSGLRIMEGSGIVSVDSTGLALKDMTVKTLYSTLSATAGIPFALMELNPSAPLNAKANGSVGMPDVEAFMPDLQAYTSKIPARSPLNFDFNASGTLAKVAIPKLDIAIPGVLSLNADGNAENALDYKKLKANVKFEGSVTNPGVIDNMLGDIGFKMPSLKLKGDAIADNQTYSARFSLLTSAGDLAAKGKVSLTSENYNADLQVRDVNVAHFAPDMGIGKVTGTIQANGAGFNPTLSHATTDVKLDVKSLVYNEETLRDIVADITLRDGNYTLSAVSENPGMQFRLDGNGTLAPDLYTFDVTGNLKNLDLQALGISRDANKGKGDIYIKGSASPEKWLYNADIRLDGMEWTVGNQYFYIPDALTASFKATGDKVAARLDADRTSLEFTSASGLQELMKTFTETADSVSKQIARRNLDVEGLQHALPSFNLDVNASGRGLLGQYLHTVGMSVDTVYMNFANDSLIWGKIGLLNASNGSMKADTLTLKFRQRDKLLDYYAHMGNRINNSSLAEFADVNLNGYLGSNRVLLSVTQKNQQGETGYRLGMTGAVTDSVVSVHFTPLKAVIAYLPWKFNSDNHIDFNLLNRHINANLMASSKESSILMQTQLGKNNNDEVHLVLNNIKIQDFLRLSVFAPPVTASVDADLTVGYTNDWLYGGGSLGVYDFTYDKLRVGDFDLGVKAGRNNDGSTGALLTLNIDKHEAMVGKMMLVPDSLGALIPKKMGVELTRFPLYVANPFLGNDVARLSGYLNGALDMSGSFTAPVLNGSIACDSVGVFVPMIGSALTFGNDSIVVADNVLRLNNFDIWGANKNPLVINGGVDASKLSSILFDLKMNAENFQLINNDKRARSDIYGKLFMDMKASATGPLDHLNLNADVNVLSNTNVTYSVPQTTAQLSQQDASGVVKFVNFNDTINVATADSVAPSMSMRIVAGLTIQPGAQVQVEIPGTATTGNGKVELSPSGTLNYFQNFMGDMRLNGQLLLGNGYVRYSVPMVGEKKFVFNPNSSVLWSGDIMNPTLNISATDDVKANLLQNGNSRIVNFLVKLGVTNTLSAPKVEFDLSTEDDMSIQNQLLSMSADQRSMAAINLLLTGQYSGEGVKTASSDLLQGQLYGLLTSQLNSWLANNVKGVDLSFGVDQYNKTVNGETGSAMSYSYTMSKSLFDNRFKISVGGNYSTDASADENFSENLISDISFEYILKQTSNVTMYVRLFRHTGYESILEGEITETGVGFVMKRRLANLKNLFNLKTWKGIPIPDAPPSEDEQKPEASDSIAVKPTEIMETTEKDGKELPDSVSDDKKVVGRKEEIVKSDSIALKPEEDYEK